MSSVSKRPLKIALLTLFLSALAFDWQTRVEEIIPRQKHSAEKGFYVTGWVAQTPKRFAALKKQARAAGLNTLVIDGKHFLEKPLLSVVKAKQLDRNTKIAPDAWLTKLITELHQEGFIVSLRLVVFKDDHLVIARPDLGVKITGGGLYRDLKQGRWADPYSAEARLYNELIAEQAALSGADEVQFDYIRFPAEGKAHSIVLPFENKEISRVEVICSFLAAVRQRLKKYNTSIAVDIFGVTAWQSKDDIKNLGQDLKKMAKYIDVLCPMLYPSHFHAGYDGFANPGSHPYYFIATGVRKTKEILSGEAVAIVPWIQGFNLRSPNFGPQYILDQVKACRDEGAKGYLIWNARNDYSLTLSGFTLSCQRKHWKNCRTLDLACQ